MPSSRVSTSAAAKSSRSSSTKPHRPRRGRQVMENDVPSLYIDNSRREGEANLDPVPAVVVPLPRRPLFPGYATAAYLRNQPSLTRSLAIEGEKTVAAFMIKDAADYQGCVLRPGLKGQELLERLNAVGTLAEVKGAVNLRKNGQVSLQGKTRVRMTGIVVKEDPLTVMVQPLEDDMDGYEDSLQADDRRSPTGMILEGMSVVRPFLGIFKLLQKLSGHSMFDRSGQPGLYLLDIWQGNLSFLADFGPAVMPVHSKGQYQRALEERSRSRRLQITTELLKRELDLDDMKRKLHLDEGFCTEEEKQLLAQLYDPEMTCFTLDDSLALKGEMLISPSVQIRVRVSEFHQSMSPDNLERATNHLKLTRMTEHMLGY